MSLTQSDLQHVEAIFDRKLEPIIGKLETLENDVKEIYNMIIELQRSVHRLEKFEGLEFEEKVLTAYRDVLAIAKEADIDLSKA